MIELLGVGVKGERGGWLVQRLCARLERGTVTAVAGSPAERAAVLDAVAGRRIPEEGRVWISRVPVMRETRRRVRALVHEVESGATFVTHRSVIWNALLPRRIRMAAFLRVPRRVEREAVARALEAVGLGRRLRDPVVALSPPDRVALAVARAIVRRPAVLVLWEIDAALGPDDAASVLQMLRRVAGPQRLTVIASLRSIAVARTNVDRALVVSDGHLVATPTPAADPNDLIADWREGLAR
jgi:ABC-type phosphate/phosphonate transport system ATPase subunit